MSIREKLAAAAGGVSLLGLAACATPEPPSSYGGIYGGQFQRTEPQGLPGDTTITYRTEQPVYDRYGNKIGSVRERSVYSNKDDYRKQSMGQELAEDFLRDAARKTQRELLKGIDFGL